MSLPREWTSTGINSKMFCSYAVSPAVLVSFQSLLKRQLHSVCSHFPRGLQNSATLGAKTFLIHHTDTYLQLYTTSAFFLLFKAKASCVNCSDVQYSVWLDGDIK